MQPDELERFKAFIEDSGGLLKDSTNIFELVRFKAGKETCLIYVNKHGHITSYNNDLAMKAHEAFKQKRPFKLVDRKRRRASEWKKTLAFRDGQDCWYCGLHFELEDLTVEHLLSARHGGSNNRNNLVLACEKCNLEAGSQSIAKKVELREKKRSQINVKNNHM